MDEARIVDRNKVVLSAAPDEVVAEERVQLRLRGVDVAAVLHASSTRAWTYACCATSIGMTAVNGSISLSRSFGPSANVVFRARASVLRISAQGLREQDRLVTTLPLSCTRHTACEPARQRQPRWASWE